jgi:hypothetical protein
LDENPVLRRAGAAGLRPSADMCRLDGFGPIHRLVAALKDRLRGVASPHCAGADAHRHPQAGRDRLPVEVDDGGSDAVADVPGRLLGGVVEQDDELVAGPARWQVVLTKL